MKKTVFTLLIFMVCAIQALAYEYFTIYFSDGTKSEAFYATDVDSICYSKLSLDGIAFDEWQVQEIYTCDSVYRYPLAQIDSLSFKDVDVNRVAEDIAHATTVITPIYAECESIEEISERLSEIRVAEGVEDAWINNQTLYVKIRDWGTITYGYKSEDESFSDVFSQDMTSIENRAAKAFRASSHQDYTEDIANMCVINQQYRDEDPNRKKSRGDAESCFINICNLWGLNPNPVNNPTPEFFAKDIYDYDFVFLMTHGSYDEKTGLHWILTGEQLYVANEDGVVDENVFGLKVRDIFEKKYPLSKDIDIVSDYISIGSYKEVRNGVRVPVYYTKVSNKWISLGGQDFKHPGKAVVFNTSCQSLMGEDENHDNDNMANAFFKRGAGLYLGYNQESGTGHIAGNGFLTGLLNGKSSYASFLSIPQRYRDYTFYSDAQRKNVHPILRYKLNPKYRNDICLTHPVTFDATLSAESSTYTLEGGIKTYMPLCNFYSNNSYNDEIEKNTYGFLISNSPEMTNAEQINIDLSSDDVSYNNQDCFLSWRATIDRIGNQELQPNTTYYYCAVMNDGYSDCYGEIKQLNTGGAEPYAVLTDNTLTFYYDNQKGIRNGMSISVSEYYTTEWFGKKEDIEKVVFDDSFSDCTIVTCTSGWFSGCENLKTIIGINKLKTDSVTNMASMFFGCRSLTTLDLSSFNTSKVTDMNGMFYGCSSLTSLDLSNFNTSNVTDMQNMFSYCSSLLSLDLSSFNTSNVTCMRYMFDNCSSLSTINLSNFNTSKVTSMTWMFARCSSLESIDVTSFDTSKVQDMSNMFRECSSLKSLDLSSFNTSNVTSMYYMFEMCSSMKSLDLSSFDNSNATMIGAFRGCDSLEYLDFRNLVLNENFSGFSGLKKLKSINLSNANTVASKSMKYLFSYCRSLENLDLSSFDTSNVTDMTSMFEQCNSLKTLDLNNFRTPNLTKMRSMFDGCNSLEHLDLSNFDLSKIEDHTRWYRTNAANSLLSLKMENTIMSGDCSWLCDYDNPHIRLREIDLSNANTTNVTSLELYVSSSINLRGCDLSNAKLYLSCPNLDLSMCVLKLYSEKIFSEICESIKMDNAILYGSCAMLFYGLENLREIDLSNVNTSNVTDMNGMFYGCSSLTSLDLSSFDISNISTGNMFYNCSSLRTIYAGNWNRHRSFYSGTGMFSGCTNLVGGMGTKIGNNLYGYTEYGWPLYYYCGDDGDAAHIDGGKDWPGLFTAK